MVFLMWVVAILSVCVPYLMGAEVKIIVASFFLGAIAIPVIVFLPFLILERLCIYNVANVDKRTLLAEGISSKKKLAKAILSNPKLGSEVKEDINNINWFQLKLAAALVWFMKH